MRRYQLYRILFLVGFWVCCALFITFYDASLPGIQTADGGRDQSFALVLTATLASALIGGFLLAGLEVLYLGQALRKMPFGLSLLIKTGTYLAFMIVFISAAIIYTLAGQMDQSLFSAPVLAEYKEFITSPRSLMTFVYWGLTCALALFLLQVNDKFGQGVLLNFLTGRYHRPKEEERVFMFMDLKSSTSLAESMGHTQYSRFIQDCFYDLTDVVIRFKARIYQYVGDEAVLTWSPADGLANGNCLHLFFAFESLLRDKSEIYKARYGAVPQFKAGLHLGPVTAAEVGIIKKELAFHGDAINTAARIQAKCGELGLEMIVSRAIENRLDRLPQFSFRDIGSMSLKGKREPVRLFEVKLL